MTLLEFREPVSACSHGVWLLLSLPGALILWRRAEGNRGRQIALLGYSACLALCALASTLYHGVRVSNTQLAWFLLADHVGIYLLIAGTYTPIAWTLMQGRARCLTLALVWAAALVGIGLDVAVGDLPGWLVTSLYLAMGWGAVFCYLELARTCSHQMLRPIVLGGLLYSIGAVFHMLQWPVLWPGVIGGHEIFHLFVVAGSATHYAFMFNVVAPWAGQPESLEPDLAAEPANALRQASKATLEVAPSSVYRRDAQAEPARMRILARSVSAPGRRAGDVEPNPG